jgi:hypothetical protein
MWSCSNLFEDAVVLLVVVNLTRPLPGRLMDGHLKLRYVQTSYQWLSRCLMFLIELLRLGTAIVDLGSSRARLVVTEKFEFSSNVARLESALLLTGSTSLKCHS